MGGAVNLRNITAVVGLGLNSVPSAGLLVAPAADFRHQHSTLLPPLQIRPGSAWTPPC